MAAVDFLHHENPPTWSGVEPATLGAEGKRKINHATQPAGKKRLNFNKESAYSGEGNVMDNVAPVPTSSEMRNISKRKFNSLPISNQLQKEDRDSVLCRLDKVFKSNGIVKRIQRVPNSRKIVAKNDANLAVSPRFRQFPIESPL
ncbi:hypothetical protein TNCV_1875611 [Trichonephila clavipes]|nr:hypothetical protein TNCV_1875611 [Trichonephila clavipes]